MTPTTSQLLAGSYIYNGTAKPASTYFSEINYRNLFAGYRHSKYCVNKSVRSPNQVWWTAEDELDMVNKCYLDWYGEPYHSPAADTTPILDLDALPDRPMRRKELRPFKINYDTYNEIKLRLLNTVISIKGHPFHVCRISQAANGDWKLLVQKSPAELYVVAYSDLVDLRTIPAMYIPGSSGGWLCRHPGKVYQQGLNKSNTLIKTVDSSGNANYFNPDYFIASFNSRVDKTWDQTMAGLLQDGEMASIRLSDDVAARTADGKIIACYKGRRLGRIQDNEVFVNDEDDLLQEWIDRAVKNVGLEMRA